MNQSREYWADIYGFENYQISTYGRVYNKRRNCYMKVSKTPFGDLKVGILDNSGVRRTMGVAKMLSDAFISPSNALCTHPVVLDGNKANICLENIVARPPSYVWLYSRQLRTEQPTHFKNLPVRNVKKGITYPSIIDAGMAEGLLFAEIWRSTYTGEAIFPDWSVFEITEIVWEEIGE
jgi:hypothetical protein